MVDDSPSIRLLIRANLELAGFDVDEAEDGAACIEWIRATPELPVVVTLDVMMPKQGGIATAAAIRSDPRTAGVGIVMVTTQSLPADIARGERAGVDAYVTKPFDPDELARTALRAGAVDVRTATEELTAAFLGWPVRTFEAAVNPDRLGWGWSMFAFRSWQRLSALDRVLSAVVPDRFYYNVGITGVKR